MNHQIVVAEAREESDRLARLDVVTSVYLEERYIDKRDLAADGRFIDEYESIAVPFVARLDGVAVGSLRLIFDGTGRGLPILSAFPLARGAPSEPNVEISQLAVLKENRRDRRIMLALIKRAVSYCRARDVDSWYAAADRRLLLRMRQMGFAFAPIGRARTYLGSVTIPLFLSLRAGLHVLRTTNPEVHEFLESPPGTYRWYSEH